ncbi:10217_t:CDS:1, partial [Rhizophagus irregularis]
MSSSNHVKKDFSSVPYEPLKPYLQLDSCSDSGSNITEGGLAKNNVLDINTQPQKNIPQTIIFNTLLSSSVPLAFSFLSIYITCSVWMT